jgi:hypothetical protein
MKFSFFDWIREGVKQSVLLGISDAAVHVGGEKDVERLNQEFLEALEQKRLVHQTGSGTGTKSRRNRRALGRSLAQVIEEKESA